MNLALGSHEESESKRLLAPLDNHASSRERPPVRGDGLYWRARSRCCGALGAMVLLAALLLLVDSWPLVRPAWLRGRSGGRITLVALNPMGEKGWHGWGSRDERGWPASAEGRRAVYEANWRCYASLHGYRLVIERNDQSARWRFAAVGTANQTASSDPLLQPAKYSPFWVKVDLLERELPGAEWVLYFDSDVVFVALPERVEAMLARVAGVADLVVGANVYGEDSADTLARTLCAGVFAVRNSPGGFWFVRRWFALRERDNLWGDQVQSAGRHPVHRRVDARAARPPARGRDYKLAGGVVDRTVRKPEFQLGRQQLGGAPDHGREAPHARRARAAGAPRAQQDWARVPTTHHVPPLAGRADCPALPVPAAAAQRVRLRAGRAPRVAQQCALRLAAVESAGWQATRADRLPA